jgi:hypothetical protein
MIHRLLDIMALAPLAHGDRRASPVGSAKTLLGFS